MKLIRIHKLLRLLQVDEKTHAVLHVHAAIAEQSHCVRLGVPSSFNRKLYLQSGLHACNRLK